jgi:hypothetical protein
MQTSLIKGFLITLVALSAARLGADTIELKNGARILGKVTKIDAGSVVVATDYAGTLTIKAVGSSFHRDGSPVAFAARKRYALRWQADAGTRRRDPDRRSDGTISTTVDKVGASWEAERWTRCRPPLDVRGLGRCRRQDRNREQIGTAGEVRATLKTLSGQSAVLLRL